VATRQLIRQEHRGTQQFVGEFAELIQVCLGISFADASQSVLELLQTNLVLFDVLANHRRDSVEFATQQTRFFDLVSSFDERTTFAGPHVNPDKIAEQRSNSQGKDGCN
jgi:hypothetical protein